MDSSQALLKACHDEDVERIKELLREPDIDVNVRNTEGETPFYLACMAKNRNIPEILLLDQRVDVFAFDNYNEHQNWVYFMFLRNSEFLLACRDIPVECIQPLVDNWSWSPDEKALIKAYLADPQGTRTRLRKKLGIENDSVTQRAGD